MRRTAPFSPAGLPRTQGPSSSIGQLDCSRRPFRAVVVIMHAGFLAGLWTARDRLDCRDDWFDSGDYLWALSIARYIPIPGRTP